MTTARTPTQQMLVLGSLATLLLGGACVLVAWLVQGTPGLWGAVVGVAIVWASSAISLLALGATRRLDPSTTMLVALVVHTGKVAVILVGLVVVASIGLLDERIDRWSLAATIVVLSLTWTTAELAAYLRTRQPTYDLDAA